MPFINPQGKRISYECSSLIGELQLDILEFGDTLEVLVVTIMREGVKLYRDYNLINEEDEGDVGFPLEEDESIERIKATELLALYVEQNKII